MGHMSTDCKELKPRLAAYVDHEVDPKGTSMIRNHIDECPECAQEVDSQKQVKKLIKQGARQFSVPAHLRAAVRRSLERHTDGFGFWARLHEIFQWQPVPAIVTVLILMIVPSVIAYYSALDQRGTPAGLPSSSQSIEAEVICMDCTLLERAEIEHQHENSHRLGLRTSDGNLLGILSTAKGKELLRNASIERNRRVQVKGQLMPALHYVIVKDFALL